MPGTKPLKIRPVRWDNGKVVVIDQRRLPLEYVELTLETPEDVAEAIRSMAVRGAPLIGIVAAYGVALAADRDPEVDTTLIALEELTRTRPTARDLFAALERMKPVVETPITVPVGTTEYDELRRRPLEEALSIHQRDLMASGVMKMYAPDIFTDKGQVMTICNAGILATGGGGTALGVIVEGYNRGLVEGVFVPETRPLLQGSRLTCWELDQQDVPFTLMPDSAAASVLKRRGVTAVVTGADRVARNGDIANKVGTRSLAILAHAAGIPFYIVAPHTTFDAGIADGSGIEIEERSADEVQTCCGIQVTPDTYPVYNPSFDVTEAELITGYVTDKGMFTPDTLKESKLWT